MLGKTYLRYVHNTAQLYKNIIKVVKTGIKEKVVLNLKMSVQLWYKSSKYGN